MMSSGRMVSWACDDGRWRSVSEMGALYRWPPRGVAYENERRPVPGGENWALILQEAAYREKNNASMPA